MLESLRILALVIMYFVIIGTPLSYFVEFTMGLTSMSQVVAKLLLTVVHVTMIIILYLNASTKTMLVFLGVMTGLFSHDYSPTLAIECSLF